MNSACSSRLKIGSDSGRRAILQDFSIFACYSPSVLDREGTLPKDVAAMKAAAKFREGGTGEEGRCGRCPSPGCCGSTRVVANEWRGAVRCAVGLL